MSSRGDRARAWMEMMRSRVSVCGLLQVPDVQYLDLRTRDGGDNNAPVEQVLIGVYPAFPLPQPHPLAIAPLYQGWTDRLGDLIVRLPAGDYHVRARKEWYAPEDAWLRNEHLDARDNRILRFDLHRLRFYLHVDANRDGVVDDWPESIDLPAPAWAWGAGNRGAIIPVNVDDDDASGAIDAGDNRVNGVADRDSDIAHLEVRRHGGANPAPANWTATLSIASPGGDPNPENFVRIFAGVAAASNRLLGNGMQQAALPAFPANVTALGMEALRYAGAGFDGIVSVRLTVTRPNGFGGNTSYMSEAELRAASWLMPNHLDHAYTVYVSRIAAAWGAADSTAFVNAVDPLIINPGPGGAGAALTQQNYNDQWMQDCMELGYATWPGTGNGVLRMEAVMRALRGGALQAMPGTLLGVNFGYTFPGQGGASTTFDSTGNLEVTPAADATAAAANGAGPKHYAWGRIYYGRGRPLEPFDAQTRQFLERQVVQTPIALNTDWLYVGHVDEMMSFIPTPGGNKPWKLLIVSPRRAYAILNQVDGGLNGGSGVTPVMQRAPNALQLSAGRYQGVVPGDYWERSAVNVAATVADLLGNGNSPIADPEDEPVVNPAYDGEAHATTLLRWDQLRVWNTGPVQNVIDGILNDLVNEIDLDLVRDLIEVPVIFLPEEHLYDPNINTVLNQHPLTIYPGQPGGYLVGALTADMVNMLVANTMLVVPRAFGPQTGAGDEFQLYLTQRITAANPALRVRYVDDWDLYHAQLGEVHCGTNTLRRPNNGNDLTNWLASNTAQWWRHPG
jgi:protein-arginine deiminase